MEGLSLVQKRTPSEEEASEMGVRAKIREDGSIQCNTVVPSAMMGPSWPASPKEWKHDEMLHPSDWSSVVVCSDKRYPYYLGRLVLKEGVGEEKVEQNLALLDRLGNVRTSIMGSIGDVQA